MGQRVVLLICLDAFVVRHLRPGITPNLCRLAATGGRAPGGGRCDLPSVTYPGHATLLTGLRVARHGLMSNRAAAQPAGGLPGWAGRARVDAPTLFDACAAAGLRSAAVCGDQHLVRILNARSATACWPSTPDVPPGVAVDLFGYATNAAVHGQAVAAVADRANHFIFVHYNETDTAGHLHGPDAPETLACSSATDRLVGDLVDAAGDPADLAVIVVSDHGMELLPDGPAIDPTTNDALAPMIEDWIDELGCALVRVREGIAPGVAGAAALRVDGIAGWTELADGVLLLEAAAGHRFGRGNPHKSLRAGHGGRDTARTLAIAGGGHPDVKLVARSIAARPPHLADWAPTIASLLGITMPADVDGLDLTRDTTA